MSNLARLPVPSPSTPNPGAARVIRRPRAAPALALVEPETEDDAARLVCGVRIGRAQGSRAFEPVPRRGPAPAVTAQDLLRGVPNNGTQGVSSSRSAPGRRRKA